MSEKTPMIKLVLTMVIEGVLIYAFLSNLTVGLLVFKMNGVAMLSGKALGWSALYSSIMTTLFYILTIWTKRGIVKKREVHFPFMVIGIPDFEKMMKNIKMDIEFNPQDFETDEIELDLDDIEDLDEDEQDAVVEKDSDQKSKNSSKA